MCFTLDQTVWIPAPVRQNSFLSASQHLYLFRCQNKCQEFKGLAHRTFCHFKSAVCNLVCSLHFTPGRLSVLHPRSAVCILPLVCSLHSTPGLQSLFHTWSALSILPLVCSLQFYPWSAVCSLPLVCSLYFAPGVQSVFYPWSAVCILPLVCSL